MANEYLDMLKNEAMPGSGQADSAPGGNPYLDMMRDEQQRQKQVFRATTSTAVDTNPDAFAREREIAKRLNTVPAAVSALPDDMNRRAKVQQIEQNVRGTPVLERKYTDADFAKLAHDDSGVLAGIEKWASSASSFAWAKARAGWFNLTGTATVLTGEVVGALNSNEAAILFKDKPEEYKKWQQSPAGFFSRASRHLFEQADRAGKDYNESAKTAYGDKVYFTSDADKSALLSPVKIVGDAIESLPTTLALMATAYLTKNAGTTARTSALEAGLSNEAALLAQREAAIKMAKISGAMSEGAVGYGQTRGAVELETSKADMSKSPRYAQLINEGYTPEMARDVVAGEVAQQSAEIAGIVDAATNMVAGKFLGKIFSESGPLLKRTAAGFLTEGTTEFVQSAGEQFGQNLAEKTTLDPATDLSKGVMESAFAGFFVGGFTGGGFAAVLGSGYDHKAHVQSAEQTKQMIDGLVAAAEQSKTHARAPEVFQEFLQSTTDGTKAQDLYISANTLNQSGLIDQVAELMPSVAEQLPEALASNGYVRIPTSEYITNVAGTDLNTALVDHLKLDPNGYTFSESQQYQTTFNQEMTTKLERMMVEQNGDAEFNQSREVVRDKFLEELNTVGRFKPEANAAFANMLASYYSVAAAKLGITPEQMVQLYQLQTQGESLTKGQLFDQNGQPTPEFKAWFSESKVVDAEGKPLKVYHGSTEKGIEVFDTSRVTTRSAKGDLPGTYFTTDKQYAAGFTRKPGASIREPRGAITEAYIRITNPLNTTEAIKQYQDEGMSFGDAKRKALQALTPENDGVIFDGDAYNPPEYIVFNPEQIKDVSNERPTNDPNIFNQPLPTDTDAFKKWFKNSVAVDANGNPLVVYHGTSRDFGVFSLQFRGENQGNDQYGPGYYTTTSPTGAGGYADGEGANIMPLYVSIQNPIRQGESPALGRDMVEMMLRASPDFEDRLANYGDVEFEGKRKVINSAVDAFMFYDDPLSQLMVIQNDFYSDPEVFLEKAADITGYDGVEVDNGGAGNFFIAWSPSQLKSVFNQNPTQDPNVLNQSATLRSGKETLKKYGLKPDGKYKTREVAAALESRQRSKYGLINPDDRSPEAVTRIAKWMQEEVLFEMQNPEKSGVGWYSAKFQTALDTMGDVFPELKEDKDARNLMTSLIAITSDGQKVVPNFAQAMDIYGRFREGGETQGQFTTSRGHSRQDSINNNLEKMQRLYDQMGPQAMHTYLMQELPIKELKKIAEANGGKMKSDYQAHIKMPMAAVEFGPKLGAFYANLMGAHGYLTMDRWWSRSFNRYRGTLLTAPTPQSLRSFADLIGKPELSDDQVLSEVVTPRNAYEARGFKTELALVVGRSEPGKAADKAKWMKDAKEKAGDGFDALLQRHNIERAANTIYKMAFENLEDAPFNATDRTFMLDAVNKAQQSLKRKGYNLSVADIQAILWYYEKRLYGELGARQTADISYEEAARKVADAYAAGNADGSGIESLLDDAGTTSEDGGELEGEVSPGDELYQSGELEQPARGQIAFGDDITRVPTIISLLKGADLSTFIHESGHFFLQVSADLASRIESRIMAGEQVSDGEKSIVEDMNKVLDWFGIKGSPERSAIQQWSSMPLEEQRPYHEQWARGFEAYAFEGKAPTMELQPIFQRFRSWLLSIYEDLKSLNVELTDEVRGVMDRMLATSEEITAAEQARNMGPMFTPETAQGIIDDWKSYHELGLAATQEGIDLLQARGLKDMKWLSNARSKKLKELQATVKEMRTALQMEARREIMSQPVYRAWQFLTAKIEADDKITPLAPRKSDPNEVTPELDSLFVAIAKLGGIQKDQAKSEWGVEERITPPVFGKPVLRVEGGLTLDGMGQLLAQYGYLTLDENGRYDLSELEEKFFDELRGATQYSNQVDPTIFLDPLPGEQVNVNALNAGRFDLSSLKFMGFDDAIVERIKDLKMTAKDGIHPDIVAELFGFTSGDELVRALASATKPKEAIEALTDSMMLQQNGELSTPEGVARAADQAIHNDAMLRFLHTEQKALDKAMDIRGDTGRVNAQGRKITYAVLPKAAREFADNIVAKLKVRNLRPSQYAAAAAKAAKEAERAHFNNDVEAAAQEKRNQILNAYTAKAAYAAQEETVKAVAYFRRFNKRSKSLDVDYYDQIVQMLERFDFVPSTSLKAIDKRKSLASWLESQRADGIEPAIPEELKLEAFRKSYKDMTIEELRGLRDTIEQLEHLGRLKNKLLAAQDAREFNEIRQTMVDSITENAGDREVQNRTPATLLGESLLAMKNFFAAHIKAATWARIMDGGKDGGPVWEYLIRTANKAGDQETVMRAKATKELMELMAPVRQEGKLGGKGTFFPSIGMSLNKEQRLAMALNMGNESNMQRLLGGEGWTLDKIKPVLDTLTSADWKFVQGVWDYFESYRPMIAEKERRIYGKEPKWIEPMPMDVHTADNEVLSLRGGYYPVNYDPRASVRAEQDLDAEEARRKLQAAYIATTTRRSFTKERVDVVEGRPLLYTLDGIYKGINEVIHDLSWHEWVIDANKIVKDTKISSAMRDHYGDYAHKQFTSWIEDTVAGDSKAMRAGEKALAWMRQGVSVAGLGINVISALIQPIGITQSIVRIGPKYVGVGLKKLIANPMELNSEVNQMSDFMRTRSMTRMRELAELRNQVKGQGKVREAIDSSAYALMLAAQRMVDLPTWWGGYEKAIGEGNDQERAVALADQAVIDAQAGGSTKDLSAIERGGPALKLFTTFYTFMNAALNMTVERTMTKNARGASSASLAVEYLLLITVPAVLTKALRDAVVPGDADDWDEDNAFMTILKEHVSFLLGMFFGLREISPIVDAVRGKPSGDYSGPAGVRIIPDTMKLAKQIGQGEADDALRKASINFLGDFLRLPSAQINRMITGAQALNEGDTSNPAAIIFGYQESK